MYIGPLWVYRTWTISPTFSSLLKIQIINFRGQNEMINYKNEISDLTETVTNIVYVPVR